MQNKTNNTNKPNQIKQTRSRKKDTYRHRNSHTQKEEDEDVVGEKQKKCTIAYMYSSTFEVQDEDDGNDD